MQQPQWLKIEHCPVIKQAQGVYIHVHVKRCTQYNCGHVTLRACYELVD